jgi:hypothetical protein
LDIGAIAVESPSAVVRFDKQGQVNWASAFTVFGEKRAARLSAKDAKPWAVQVGAVDLVKGTARVEDQQLDPAMAVALDQLALRLEHLSSDLESPVTARASVRINDAGVATANGTVVPDPLSAALDVAVSGLNLAPFWRYAKVSTADLRGGAAGAHGKVLIAPGSPRVRFDGEAVLDGLELVDESASRVVAWKQSLAKGVRLTVAPGRLRIAEVVLDQGFIKTLIDRQGNLNLTRLAGGASAPSSATSSPKPAASSSSGASFPVDVTTISIRDAKIDYGDESLILPFGTDIHAANGTIKDLSTTSAAPARLALEGRVAETGYVKVAGTLRVADPLAATEIDVTFRDVSMPALTPYVAQFAGYAVQDGHLDLDVHYRIVDRRLLGDHRVVAKDLVLGPKVEGASGPPLPLRLAIALLKDKDGRVDLEVPIEGSVDAPEFAYRKVFWQAVRKILANVALAPFRAIGRMFGRDDEDLDLVGFASGRSDLLPPEQETLAKLAAELAKRPGVTIEVEGRFDPVADVVAIRRARLEARIDAKRGSQENLEAILEALYVETFSPDRLETERGKFTAATFDAAGFYDALRAQLLEHETVGAPELTALGHARAAAIAGALTAPGGLDATRVTAKDPAPVSRKKRGADLVASQMAMSAND